MAARLAKHSKGNRTAAYIAAGLFFGKKIPCIAPGGEDLISEAIGSDR